MSSDEDEDDEAGMGNREDREGRERHNRAEGKDTTVTETITTSRSIANPSGGYKYFFSATLHAHCYL